MIGLKNFFQPTDLFGRFLYSTNGIDIIEYKVITFSDIKAGSNFNFKDDSTGTLNLDFTKENFYWEIYDLCTQYPVIFELFIYKKYTNLGTNEYNLFYFPTKNNFVDNQNSGERSYVFQMSTVKQYEDNTFVEHNKEYDFDEVPVDPISGVKLMPNDFNKWRFTGQLSDAIFQMWDENWVNPVNRLKGAHHTTGDYRKFIGMGTFSVMPVTQTPIDVLVEKQRLSQLRDFCYNISKGLGEYNRHILEIKYNETTLKLDFYFNYYPPLSIVHDQSADGYSYFSRANDVSNDIVDVLAESAKPDEWGYAHEEVNLKPYDWKRREGLISVPPTENELYATTFQNAAISHASEFEAIKETNLTIDFAEQDYFKDLKAGQIVTLSGFKQNINGQYQIRQISGVINDSNIGFSVDDMEELL